MVIGAQFQFWWCRSCLLLLCFYFIFGASTPVLKPFPSVITPKEELWKESVEWMRKTFYWQCYHSTVSLYLPNGIGHNKTLFRASSFSFGTSLPGYVNEKCLCFGLTSLSFRFCCCLILIWSWICFLTSGGVDGQYSCSVVVVFFFNILFASETEISIFQPFQGLLLQRVDPYICLPRKLSL